MPCSLRPPAHAVRRLHRWALPTEVVCQLCVLSADLDADCAPAAEMAITIDMLPIFFKQRDDCM